jgi:hypothetical protein
MRLAVHIFKKDMRRLWWETAVATGALAYLAHMDANRMDYMPGPMEGMMNLVVPAAWAYLIAMLVHQEPLVGDRQFWLTRPYPRSSLLGAKLLFVLCFIHLPMFAFDAAIVQARGFNALAHLPDLLGKQATLAASLTVPALALAAVTRNLAQFASAGLLCVVAGYLLTASFTPPWVRVDTVRRDGALVLLACGGVIAIALQYAQRRVRLSRSIALVAFASAILLTVYVPRRYTIALGCRGAQQAGLVLSQHATPPPDYLRYYDPGTSAVSLPVTLRGVPTGATVVFEPLEFDIERSDGERWSMMPIRARPGPPQRRNPINPGVVMQEANTNGWLVLSIDQKLFSAMSAKPVRLRGEFAGNVVIQDRKTELPPETPAIMVPSLGRCASFMVENAFSPFQNDLLKTICESPDEIPRSRVDFVEPGSGLRVRHGLGDSGTPALYPTGTWLSPVNRRNTFFHIVEGPLQIDDRWRVPRSALAGGKLEFAPQRSAGCSVVRIAFNSIDLRQYLLFPER